MSTYIRFIAIAVLVAVSASSVQAFGGRWVGTTAGYRTTYYFQPTFYTPVQTASTVAYYTPTIAAAPTVTYYTPTVAAAPTVTFYTPTVAAAPIVTYYAAPVVDCPPPVVAVPAQPAPVFAQPMPAPPSPPAAPRVQESSSLRVARFGPANDSIQAGFWNATPRTITLNVNGQAMIVPSGQMVNVNVPRQFTWQYDQGQFYSEFVPADRGTMEIVIRQ